MKFARVAILAAVPLTIIGLIVAFAVAVAGAGHGDKSLILFIFPLPALVWVYSGFELGLLLLVCNSHFTRYIHLASKRRWEWPLAGALLVIHFGMVLCFSRHADNAAQHIASKQESTVIFLSGIEQALAVV